MISKVLKSGISSISKASVGRFYGPRLERAWSIGPNTYWNWQQIRFMEAYDFALRRVPHYRDRPEAYPVLPQSKPLFEQLALLPILEKATLKDNNADFWATPRQRFTTFHATSGTSGTPLRIPATLSERSQINAILAGWYKRICGVSRPRTLVLSGFLSPEPGSDRLHWTDRVGNRVFLSIYSLIEGNKDEIRSLLSTFRPQMIYGYASAVNQLASLFRDEEAPFRSERVAVVTSEVLEPQWRGNMESSVVRKVYNLYGSQEGAALALECDERSLHIHPSVGVIEIVDDRGLPVQPGVTGRMLLTSTLRKSFPLFRYEIGDSAESTGFDTGCACGLTWPTIGPVHGRSEDLVRTRDGRKIGYLCFHATKDLAGIAEAQLVQESFDSFRFAIVPSKIEVFDRNAIEASITANLQRRIQSDVRIAFEYMDAIPRGPRGKFKAVVVDFDPDTSLTRVSQDK